MSPPRPYMPSPLFDDVGKVNKCRQPRRLTGTSREAWQRVRSRRREIYARILAFVRGCGQSGATLKELAIALGKPKSDFSGRLSELIAAGELQVLRDANGGEVVRGGCRVLVAAAMA
jgi:hypothetical protein